MLTSKERAYLRGLANRESAIMQIGKGGISENLVKTVSDALEARELIKLSVLENCDYATMGYLDQIPVCTAYEADGEIITDFPATPVLMRCKPVYTLLPGWKQDVRGITDWNALPENCRRYIEFIEKQLETPVTMVSTGPKRSEMILRNA